MSPLSIFAAQFVWFLLSWSVLAALFVLPRLRTLPDDDALAIAIVPQMFRVLGLGLLVPQLSPGMLYSFAVPTAVGDSLTAVLALASVVTLRRRHPIGRKLAWACTIVGIVDLAVALPHAAAIGAAQFLAAQWFVPTVIVPLMIVSHVVAFLMLQRSARAPH